MSNTSLEHHTPSKSVLNLGCGEDTKRDAHNVDIVPSVEPDQIVDLNEFPWPWPDESFQVIIAEHVFEHLTDIEQALREAARILEPNGELRIVVPMGVNARADPDHEHEWTWQTPGFYCGHRHWDVDVGLRVTDRVVDMHCLRRPPRLARIYEAYWDWCLRWWGAGEWCFGLPCMSGSFTVIFTNQS